MVRDFLLEDRIHGDSMFPIRVYTVDYLDGDVIFNVHWHPEMEFLYLEKGTINLQIGTGHLTLSEGSACFIPSEQLHGAYPVGDTPFKLHAIVFHINLLRSFSYDWIEKNYLDFITNPTYYPSIRVLSDANGERGKDMLYKLNQIVDVYAAEAPSYELVIKGNLFLVFAGMLENQECNNNDQLTQKDRTKIALLKKALQYINDNFNQKLTVSKLATQVQMSEGHFSRFFKSLVRMTPMEYINTIRINKACTLLQKTDRKLIDIAMDVGFNNQSYFIRLFKKQKDCTPKEYRMKT